MTAGTALISGVTRAKVWLLPGKMLKSVDGVSVCSLLRKRVSPSILKSRGQPNEIENRKSLSLSREWPHTLQDNHKDLTRNRKLFLNKTSSEAVRTSRFGYNSDTKDFGTTYKYIRQNFEYVVF